MSSSVNSYTPVVTKLSQEPVFSYNYTDHEAWRVFLESEHLLQLEDRATDKPISCTHKHCRTDRGRKIADSGIVVLRLVVSSVGRDHVALQTAYDWYKCRLTEASEAYAQSQGSFTIHGLVAETIVKPDGSKRMDFYASEFEIRR
ncbi:uncharacterized protein I303_105068 [Kwoniella dejecticola CBS 10117]|uniref:Uncharacterized protein n=1 Tax=Kwoniella dejecticola CBS 10117 TaxID=1296121 RepID=A0A1A6A3J3_9TREE|nr:uncharacterized protein I303_05486 [Kwoniella dejecticola CBS 10117]OBR84627.1 hypothetical protein I303_05486 [Kwoniella dejecticola CBS 10117]